MSQIFLLIVAVGIVANVFLLFRLLRGLQSIRQEMITHRRELRDSFSSAVRDIRASVDSVRLSVEATKIASDGDTDAQ